MSVLDRDALEESPLADLHALAYELGVDGFRRLRRPQLIDAILGQQSGEAPTEGAAADVEDAARADVDTAPAGEDAAPADEDTAPADEDTARADEDTEEARRGRRRGRRRRRTDEDRDEAPERAEGVVVADGGPPEEAAKAEPRRGRRPEAREEPAEQEERIVEGVVELLANGSGFVRVAPPEPSDEDVYVSPAQVKRCSLVSGDRVSGPVRAPRRSERFASLLRVDLINGQPVEEVAEGKRFEELPAAFPTERFALGAEDPTLKAIEFLTPFGRGSRVTVVGAARAGKTEALRRLAAALAAVEDVEVTLVLAGVRPEEMGDWPVEPTAVVPLGESAEAQTQAAERALEMAKRIASRGGNAVVLIDSVAALPPQTARRLLAAARSVPDGGSLTVVAAAPAPVGGETTVIALDARLAAMRRFPALSLPESGTLRSELLVGDAGAQAIAQAYASAMDAD